MVLECHRNPLDIPDEPHLLSQSIFIAIYWLIAHLQYQFTTRSNLRKG